MTNTTWYFMIIHCQAVDVINESPLIATVQSEGFDFNIKGFIPTTGVDIEPLMKGLPRLCQCLWVLSLTFVVKVLHFPKQTLEMKGPYGSL
jgi:hypothetical protein